jgi:hypothetical protein
MDADASNSNSKDDFVSAGYGGANISRSLAKNPAFSSEACFSFEEFLFLILYRLKYHLFSKPTTRNRLLQNNKRGL